MIEINQDSNQSPALQKLSRTQKAKIIPCFKQLTDANLIFHGSIISQDDLENVFSMTYSPDNWVFRGMLMALRLRIKSEGFFITDRGHKAPEFGLVAAQDMATYAEKRVKRNVWSNFETAYILAAADVHTLNEEEKKRHRSVQVKAAQVALMQQKMMMEDNFF